MCICVCAYTAQTVARLAISLCLSLSPFSQQAQIAPLSPVNEWLHSLLALSNRSIEPILLAETAHLLLSFSPLVAPSLRSFSLPHPPSFFLTGTDYAGQINETDCFARAAPVGAEMDEPISLNADTSPAHTHAHTDVRPPPSRSVSEVTG